MPANPKSILGLDVGNRRVGVAMASLTARLAQPLKTLVRDDYFFENLQEIITDEGVEALVVGFPRGLDGQRTAQTDAIETFVEELRQHTDLPCHLQDEAVTSKQAEAELEARGKTYQKGDIDALAATYILDDFLAEQREESR